MSDIWQGFFYSEEEQGCFVDIEAPIGFYYGTGSDINAEICISEQSVSDFINLKPDGSTIH